MKFDRTNVSSACDACQQKQKIIEDWISTYVSIQIIENILKISEPAL